MRALLAIGALAVVVAGCAGGQDSGGPEASEGAIGGPGVGEGDCAVPEKEAGQDSFEYLKSLESCQLKALFESEAAKNATTNLNATFISR